MPTDIVLEELDPETNSIVGLVRIPRSDFDDADWVAVEDEEDLRHARIELSIKETARLKKQLKLTTAFKKSRGRLRHWHDGESLELRSHTNRELLLMLQGQKPMAVFHDVYPNRIGSALYAYQPFERFVKKGVINKTLIVRKTDKPNPEKSVFSFFRDYYTLPGEEWRIAEYETLRAEDGQWTLKKERREGELLGYTDEENNRHIAWLRKQEIYIEG